MDKVLVCGASGFIGHHLAKYLKNKGFYVIGVDIQRLNYKECVNEFHKIDLTNRKNCLKITRGVKEIYQLAAQMGGMGFIATEHLASLNDSNLINTYMAETAYLNKVDRIFFSSSVCVYPVGLINKGKKVKERDSYPAEPNEAYGWEKLTAEKRYFAYQKERGLKVRIARFDNTYGPECIFEGGREKAPAALCRKIALAEQKDKVEVWGNGRATRHFTYIDDLVEGIEKLMHSDCDTPINLGSDELVTINQLAKIIINIANNDLKIKNIPINFVE